MVYSTARARPISVVKCNLIIYVPTAVAGLGRREPLVYRDQLLTAFCQLIAEEFSELTKSVVVGGFRKV